MCSPAPGPQSRHGSRCLQRAARDFSLDITSTGLGELESAKAVIPAGTPVQLAFPGNGDLAGRVSTARAIKRAGFEPVPIIAARRLRSEDMLGEYLAALRAANASESVLVVAGDPAEPEGPYPDAATVIGSHNTEKELLMNYSDRTDQTTSTMDLQELAERAIKIHDLYEELNRRDRGRDWTREEFMLGFVGDIGDLAKLVMAQEGAREMPGGREALEHELADCLWSVLILAHHYHVNLGAAFTRTMDELDQSISERLSASGPVQPDLVPMMKTT